MKKILKTIFSWIYYFLICSGLIYGTWRAMHIEDPFPLVGIICAILLTETAVYKDQNKKRLSSTEDKKE